MATGGPLALILGFGIVGIMLFCVIHALGELAVVFPIAGTDPVLLNLTFQDPFPSTVPGLLIQLGALQWVGIMLWAGWLFFLLN